MPENVGNLNKHLIYLRANAFGLESTEFQDYNFKIEKINRFYKSINPHDLESLSQKKFLELFQLMARYVPAYGDFLKQHKVDYRKITSVSDYKFIPVINKENYINRYDLKYRCWMGDLSNTNFLSVSSGSSGKPSFWPRSTIDELETAVHHDLILSNYFKADSKKTLIVLCYSLGIYVGGIYTLNSLSKISKKEYPFNIITPGIQISDALSSIKALIDQYEQVVFLGYPPFILDLIDAGHNEYSIEWNKYKIHFLFSSENFSEDFVNYVLEYISSDYTSSSIINLYACSDMAVIGYSTPMVSLIRKYLYENPDVLEKIFPGESIPSLHQYNPLLKFIEIINNEIIISADGAVPLVRYNIHDRGGVLQLSDVLEKFKSSGINIRADIEKIPNSLKWNLPYVYLFGRSDLTVTLYGINIYPENIKIIFEEDFMKENFSGNFILQQKNRDDQSQYVLINLELKKNKKVHDDEHRVVMHYIIQALDKYNKEFHFLNKYLRKKDSLITLKFHTFGDSQFVTAGLKNKYIIS